MKTTEGWSVDLKQCVVTHESGLSVTIVRGEVMDIVAMPKGFATRELPRLLAEAEQAFASANAAGISRPVERNPEPPPSSGPRKDRLKLKKRDTSTS